MTVPDERHELADRGDGRGGMGSLSWLLLASTWPTPPRAPRRCVGAERQADFAMGRHALIEDDDTEPLGGRHCLGSPNATVSVAGLLTDALHEQRALQRAWPAEDPDGNQ